MRHQLMLTAALCLLATTPAAAQGLAGKAAHELAESALKRFGRGAAAEGAETLAGKIASAAARHGDEAVEAAVRKAGPKALTLADDAGEQGAQALRLLAQHGDAVAPALANRSSRLLLARYGDDAATALLKHPAVSEPLLNGYGAPAVQALQAIGPQNGRRLAMLDQSGELAAFRRSDELLTAIGRHGDACMEFVWKHKAVLAGGAALAAFLADPAPYLSGAKELTAIVAPPAITGAAQVAESVAGHLIDGTADIVTSLSGQVAAPLAASTGTAIEETAEAAAWPLAVLICTAAAAGLSLSLWRLYAPRRARPAIVPSGVSSPRDLAASPAPGNSAGSDVTPLP